MTTQTEQTTIPALTVGWRIRMAREFAGIDQTELAERTEIARSTISNYEKGATTHVKPLYLRQIALATGVDLEWLTNGTGVTGGELFPVTWPVMMPRPPTAAAA
jgi:transcriptional regulator with XRE-family HTH domain